MRLIEFIIIYLAAAAPVGVVAFFRQFARDPRHTRLVARSIIAGLLFPFTLFNYAFNPRRDAGNALHHRDDTARDAKIEAARRALIDALHHIADSARESKDSRAAHAFNVAHALTAQVECYAGVTLALMHVEPAGEPLEHELELARLAGRTGDDLEIAGRCMRRRNLSRLHEQQARSRLDLLHALAELQDTLKFFNDPPASHYANNVTIGASVSACFPALQLAPALLRIYERAFSLFMLLEDERGVQTLTRLLDATRSRLYHHHESSSTDNAARATRHDSKGVAPCQSHNPQSLSLNHTATSTPHATQTMPTPLSTLV